MLSKAYLFETKGQFSPDELVVFDTEPTAENLLLFLSREISLVLPGSVSLYSLRIWETRDSYAEWSA
jgi:6-pyruvoyltetrahydropterin/6-carboxytetrahydropterin synthase